MLHGLAGNNLTEGNIVGIEMLGEYGVTTSWSAGAGLQSYGDGNFAFTLTSTNRLPGDWSGLFASWRLLGRVFPQWDAGMIATMVEAGMDGKHWCVALGFTNIISGPAQMLNFSQGVDYLTEPFNLMYKVGYHTGVGKRSVLSGRVSNYDDFLVEVAYQPLFTVAWNYVLNDRLSMDCRLRVHPTGLLSLSANYYEIMLIVGVKWVW